MVAPDPSGEQIVARLRTLGALELTGANGAPVHAIISRQRRIALLVYLAVEARDTFTRRDILFTLFWPDTDQARARAALRQALYVLRSETGIDLVATRGTEEVAASPSLKCDAVEFERLADAGRNAEALALHRGPFLDGFHIPDAAEFERWVETRRDTLRRRAIACARGVAAEATAKGDIVTAIQACRRILEFDAVDELAARALMDLLDAAGDRGAALRVFDSLAATLERDLGLAPVPETRALADAIRAGRGAPGADATGRADASAEILRAAMPAMPASHGSPDPVPAAPRVLTPPPAAAQTTRSRRVPWLAATIVVIGMVLGVARAVSRSTATDLPQTRLVVLPFAVRGGSEIAYLGEGMADMLSTSLDGPGLYRSVPSTAVLRDARLRGAAPDDRAAAAATARRFSAERFVIGSVVAAGTQLRFDARLYGVPDSVLARAEVIGHPDSVFQLVDRVTAQLIAGSRGQAPADRMRGTAALTTHSLAALREYLQGERLLREGEFERARDFFRRAVATDSTFALAHYRLSMASSWAGDPPAARANAELAARHAYRLSARDRSLLTAHHLTLKGRSDEAEAACRAILAVSPDDVETWLQLGELLFHHNPPRGRAIDEARPAFERVLAHDSGHRAALVHLVRIAASVGDVALVDSLANRYEATAVEAGRLAVRVLRVLVRGERTLPGTLMREAAGAGYDAVADAGRAALLHAHDPDAARALMLLNVTSDQGADRRALAHLGLAATELAAGRPEAAQPHFKAAATTFPAIARDLEIYYALRLGEAPARERLIEMRDRLQFGGAKAVEEAPRMQLLAMLARVEPVIREALLSEVYARLGDAAEAGQRAAAAEQFAVDPDVEGMRQVIVRELRARRALAAGHTDAALDDARYLPANDVAISAIGFPWSGGARMAAGEALVAAGRHAEATRWFGSLDYQSIFLSPFVSPARLELGRLRERLGNDALAASDYAAVAKLWSRAADPFAALAADARSRVAAKGAVRSR
jgi:DNA-binding SARP family transcriptional activator/tetratricopeptide (TPR) repeat protein